MKKIVLTLALILSSFIGYSEGDSIKKSNNQIVRQDTVMGALKIIEVSNNQLRETLTPSVAIYDVYDDYRKEIKSIHVPKEDSNGDIAVFVPIDLTKWYLFVPEDKIYFK